MTILALASLVATPLLPAQEPAPAQGAEPRSDHLFTMAFGDAGQWLSHEKDQGVLRAMGMLAPRLGELSRELGGAVPPDSWWLQPDAMDTWMDLLRSPKRFSVYIAGAELRQQGQPIAVGAAIDGADEESAEEMRAALVRLLGEAANGFPVDQIRRSGSTIGFEMGAEARPMGTTEAAKLVRGDLAMEMDMNVGGYLAFIQDMVMQNGAPAEAAMIFEVLGRMGLDQAVVQVAVACDGDIARTASIVTEIGGRMQRSGILPAEGITARDLAPIPGDATWMSVQRLDLAAVIDAMNDIATELMREQGIEEGDALEMIANTTGLDLRSGLFGALGQTVGMYAAESLGGRSVTSTVAFASVRDIDALLDTREQIVDMLNGLAQNYANGYVTARTWTDGDEEYTTLMFPGLPVPMEPTLGFGEEWMVVAMTPQSALGAMRQITSGDAGMGGNPAIARLADGSKCGLTYMDTAYYAESGYGITSMFLSGLANGVRSRFDGLRDPGPMLPLYPQFMEGIKPAISTTEVRGDDLVTIEVADNSFVVGIASMVGFLSDYAGIIAIPAAAAAAPEVMRELGIRF